MSSTTRPFLEPFLSKNAKFVETYQTPPTMTQMRAQLLSNPSAGGSLILTCVDPRVVPEQFFGPGLQSAVLRNAGGRISSDVIRSITVLRSLANLQLIMVVHHTDCGMTHLTQEGIAKDVKERTPEAVKEIEATDYGCFHAADFEKTIEGDVTLLRGAKALEGMTIVGMKLDTPTGKVEVLDV